MLFRSNLTFARFVGTPSFEHVISRGTLDKTREHASVRLADSHSPSTILPRNGFCCDWSARPRASSFKARIFRERPFCHRWPALHLVGVQSYTLRTPTIKLLHLIFVNFHRAPRGAELDGPQRGPPLRYLWTSRFRPPQTFYRPLLQLSHLLL